MRSNTWQRGGSYAYLAYAIIAPLLLAFASIAAPTRALAAAGDELFTIGQTYYNSGDFNNAIVNLENFVNQYPTHKHRNKGELYLGCSYLNRNNGTTDITASRQHFTYVINQGKKAECYRDAFFHNARSYYNVGDYNTARTLLLQFLNDYPQDNFLEYVYYYLGVCETNVGVLDQALVYYTKFESLYPNSALIWYSKLDKATIYGRQGQYAQADQQLSLIAADANAPANVVGLATNQRALLMEVQGNVQGAISLLDGFIQKYRYNRTDAALVEVLQDSYLYEAHAYFMLKDYNRALNLVKEVESLNGSLPPDAATLKIKILIVQKQTAEAETILNALASSAYGLQEPDLVTSLRAMIDLANGRYDAVISSLNAMLSPRAMNATSSIVEFHYYDAARNHLDPIDFIEACGVLTIAYAARFATAKNQSDYTAQDSLYQATARYVDGLKSPAGNLVLSAINTARLETLSNPSLAQQSTFTVVAPNSFSGVQTDGFTQQPIPQNQSFSPLTPQNQQTVPNQTSTQILPSNQPPQQPGVNNSFQLPPGTNAVNGQNTALNVPTLPNAPNSGPTTAMRPALASGVSVNQQGFLVNQSGQYVDTNGRVLTTAGQYYNANGQLVNAQGQLINQNGQLVNAQGQPINQSVQGVFVNQQGQLVNAQNQFVDPSGRLMTTPGQYYNAQGQLVGANGQIISQPGQPAQQPVQGVFVNAQGQLVNAQNQLVDPNGRLLTTTGQYYNAQGQLVNAQGQPVNTQGQPTNAPNQPGVPNQPNQTQQNANAATTNQQPQQQETPLTPEEARAALDRATGYYENLEFDRANEILLEATTKSETFWQDCPAEAARISLLRANALLELGKRSEAQMTCEDLVSHAPNTQEASVAYYYLGALADSVGRSDDAVKYLRLATTGRGNFPYADAALYTLGTNELERGDVNAATHTFGRLYRDYPTSPYWSHAVWRLAKIEADLRNDVPAEKLVNEALARRPDASIIDYLLFLKGEIALRAKDYDKALVAFDMIIDQYPDSVWYAHAKNRLATIPQRFLNPAATTSPVNYETVDKTNGDRYEPAAEAPLAPPSPRNAAPVQRGDDRYYDDRRYDDRGYDDRRYDDRYYDDRPAPSRTSVQMPSASDMRARAASGLTVGGSGSPVGGSSSTSAAPRTSTSSPTSKTPMASPSTKSK